MGQKVNPHGARVGVILPWSTKWYAEKKDFSNNLIEDYKLREMLYAKLDVAGISDIDIERSAGKVTVTIHTAKPGIVIGRSGKDVEVLKKEIEKFTGKAVSLNVVKIDNPDADAQLVAENIAQQGGADIARTEGYHEGSIPLQTLRANIDYGFAEARTTYGRIGVKVWIYKGQVLPTAKKVEQAAPRARRAEGGK